MASVPLCGDAFAVGTNSSASVRCAKDSGFSFTRITRSPTSKEIKKMCASSFCSTLITSITLARPNECLVSHDDALKLYNSVLNPIAAVCSKKPATTATAPTPTSKTPSPVPTTQATPAAAGNATVTTARANTTAASSGGGSQSEAGVPASATRRPETRSEDGVDASSSSSSFTLAPNDFPAPSPAAAAISPCSDHAATSNQITSPARDSLNVGIVLAAAGGGVVIVAAAAFIALFLDRKRRRATRNDSMLRRTPVNYVDHSEAIDASSSRDSYDTVSPVPTWLKGREV